jgi:two-component system, cell cycle sensor histidine kinase and response regulator CckA
MNTSERSRENESEDLFRCLVDNMLDAAVIVNRSGTVLFSNKAGAALVGIDDPRSVVGSSIKDFIHPDSLSDAFNHLVLVSEGQGGFPFEYQIIAKDGILKWVEALGDKVMFGGQPADLITLRDITRRKAAEQSLSESEERYRQFFEDNISGAYIAKADGQIVTCNSAFIKMLGFSSIEEALKTNAGIIYHESQPRAKILELIKKEKKLVNYESIMRRIDGDPINIIENMTGVFDADGNLIEIKGFLIDITQRKKLEEQLQQAQKMEAIGTLAGGIAHDFNNLLMSIQGYVSLMLLGTNPSHPFHIWLNNIEDRIQSGAKLTSQLLGYARKGRYEVKSLSLNQIIRETTETFGRIKRDIRIELILQDNLPGIRADKVQVEQVLLNLFVNAADAMPEGGFLTVATTVVSERNMQDGLYEPKAGQYVKMTVTDTGVGMDKQTQSRIFEPFFTTKEMGRGTGLGLASVYGIVKAHGGYIDVASKKAAGTTFTVYFPARRQKVPQTVKNTNIKTKKTGTILLVDDEEDILRIGAKVLQKFDYKVLEAKNGPEAIEIYAENKDEIDLIILDLVMPDMNGSEVYDRLKDINPAARILLCSGYSIEGRAKGIIDRGCDDFIQKPFTYKILTEKLDEILSR